MKNIGIIIELYKIVDNKVSLSYINEWSIVKNNEDLNFQKADIL